MYNMNVCKRILSGNVWSLNFTAHFINGGSHVRTVVALSSFSDKGFLTCVQEIILVRVVGCQNVERKQINTKIHLKGLQWINKEN